MRGWTRTSRSQRKKGGLHSAIAQEFETEVERLIGDGALNDIDFQMIEIEARRVALQLMGQAVAGRLNADRSDERGPHLPCECGAEARFAGRRNKTFTTALGPLTLERAWYHSDSCHHGFSPRDRALGMEDSFLSPAALRMMGIAAARTSFAGASALLRELAGLAVAPKTVERHAEALGREVAGDESRGILGDGAAWIWNFADEHLPDAIQVVDIFPAKGHLFEAAKAVYGSGSEVGEQWARKRREELDEGRVEDVIGALRRHAGTCEQARKDAEYFSTNRERMNYPRFRAMGLCVATGVVEGGCKHIVGIRLKRGGMRRSVADANAIIALRCAVESNRFDDFWERRAGATS